MHTLMNVAEELHGGEFIYRHFGATVDDYYRLANEGTRLELIDGVLTVHSPASYRHERLFKFLMFITEGFSSERNAGCVLGSRMAVVLDDDRRVEPDLVFLKAEHVGRIGDVFINGPVDWVIEILSPATRDYDLGEKRRIYADAGISEAWFVDPLNNQLLIDRPAGRRVDEKAAGRAICEPLAGFWIDVAWLWENPLPSPLKCLNQILKHNT